MKKATKDRLTKEVKKTQSVHTKTLDIIAESRQKLALLTQQLNTTQNNVTNHIQEWKDVLDANKAAMGGILNSLNLGSEEMKK